MRQLVTFTVVNVVCRRKLNLKIDSNPQGNFLQLLLVQNEIMPKIHVADVFISGKCLG